MSKTNTEVEDDLVSNDELNPRVQIEKTEAAPTINKPKFNINLKKVWDKRWKILSCCLGVHCIVFLIAVCILASQYVDVKRKLRFVSRRICKDVGMLTMVLVYIYISGLCVLNEI